MTATHVSTDPQTPSDPKDRERAEQRRTKSLGRRIALGIYWACALYVAGVGFWSIPKQIFFPQPADQRPAGSCVEGMVALRGQLLAEMQHTGAADGEPLDRRPFFRAWDARFRNYERACEVEAEDAYIAIERLRYEVEGALVRHDRETAPLLRDVALALARVSPERAPQ